MTLSYQTLKYLSTNGYIKNLEERCIQPASFDIQLTGEIYRMPGSILPGDGKTVRELVTSRQLYKLTEGQPLELNCYYLCKAKVDFNLPDDICGTANNKSSSGRINLQGRLVLDNSERYDFIPKGYKGEVWVELHPRLCLVKLDPNDAINQVRLKHFTSQGIKEKEIRNIHKKTPLLYHPNGEPLSNSELQFGNDGHTLLVSVGLDIDICGYRGRERSNEVLDLSRRDNDPTKLFSPIQGHRNLWMHKDEFYILSSGVRVSNPPQLCITMLPYHSEHGEFRSHFAGFFDPGNGYGKLGDEKGFSVTMEVIPMEDAIEVRSGQPMFSIQIDYMDKIPDKLYGINYNSNYFCNPGPKLAKFFSPYPN